MRWPFLLPLSFGIAGLCTAQLCNLAPPLWTLPALLFPLAAAIFTRSRIPFLVAVILFFFTWGELSLQRSLECDPAWKEAAGKEPVEVAAVVDARPEGMAGGARLYLRVESLRLGTQEFHPADRLLLRVEQRKPLLYTGDRVLFSSRIRVPRRYGLPGERDYARDLALKGVGGTAFVKDADDLVLLRSGEGCSWHLDRLAARMGRFIDGSVPGAAGAVLKALLIGDASGIAPEVNDAYARSGVNHILSISGFHVGILFVALFQALFLVARCFEPLALRCNLRRTLLLAALPVTVFYLFLSGAAPATVRSVLMIAAFTVALFVNREVDPIQVIILAACAMLALHPADLFNVSFQLSFLAVWGLAVLTPLLMRPFRAAQGGVKGALYFLCATAAAILATAVPVAYYFGRVSFTGFLANIVVVPLMGYGAVVLGFCALLLYFVLPHPARLLLQLAGHGVGVCNAFVAWCAKAPVFTNYHPQGRDVFLGCLLLAALTFLPTVRWRSLAAALLLLFIGYDAVPASAKGDGALQVIFLSVGQGDSALLRLPDGKTMLLDGGGSAAEGDTRTGERLLLPALRHLGVRRIDYLVLSHAHPDHCQGLLPVAAQLEVGEFWENGVTSSLSDYQALKWVIVSRGIPVRRLDAATAPFTAGGAAVRPLWPPPHYEAGDDANESCLVLRVACGGAAVLFTADLGEKEERELLRQGAPLQCTLLKVAHHGSRYSSCDDFLRACRPEAAVISAGYGNWFHLPAPTTIERLQRRGIHLYRTDLDGSVLAQLTPDGRCRVTLPWGALQ